ncbi:MAG: response regulator [Agrobacterium sp.]|uniref:response regulator n=1 Tax=Agrobacterium sp. TaxID=361 RepID=UPI004034C27B
MLPDLILLDVMMPGMSGYEVCTQLRKKYSSALLPIIMVSACCAEKDVVQVGVGAHTMPL